MKTHFNSLHLILAAGLMLTTSMNAALAQKGGSRGGASRSSSFGNSSMRMNSGSNLKGIQSNLNAKTLPASSTNLSKQQNPAVAKKPTIEGNPSLVSKKPSSLPGNVSSTQLAGLKNGSKVAKPGNFQVSNAGLTSFAKGSVNNTFRSNFYCGTGWGNHHHHWRHWGCGWGYGYHSFFGNHWCHNYCYSPFYYSPCLTSYCLPIEQYCYTSPVICQPMTQYVSIIEQESLPVTVIENTPVSSDAKPAIPMDNTFITGSVVGG